MPAVLYLSLMVDQIVWQHSMHGVQLSAIIDTSLVYIQCRYGIIIDGDFISLFHSLIRCRDCVCGCTWRCSYSYLKCPVDPLVSVHGHDIIILLFTALLYKLLLSLCFPSIFIFLSLSYYDIICCYYPMRAACTQGVE